MLPAKLHWKRIALFLTAVVLPSLALIYVSLRLIEQDEQLEEARAAEEYARTVRAISSEAMVVLEEVRLRANDALDEPSLDSEAIRDVPTGVSLVAWQDGETVEFSWERLCKPQSLEAESIELEFARHVERGEQFEFRAINLEKAIREYRRALRVSTTPIQRAQANLILARSKLKLGQPDSAGYHYQLVAASPTDACDEFGIPMAVYGIRGLLLTEGSPVRALEHLIRIIETRFAVRPEGVAAIRAMIGGPESPFSRDQLDDLTSRLDRLETMHAQADRLRNQLPFLVESVDEPSSDGRDQGRWTPVGGEPSLVFVDRIRREGAPNVIVVPSNYIVREFNAGNANVPQAIDELVFLPPTDTRGASLGPGLGGLRVKFDPTRAVWRVDSGARRNYLGLAVLLILCTTLFGGYLLWRDVRREARVAVMRAQFVSSVSHELRTPLTAIRMFAETLKMGRADDPEIRQEYLDTIVHESERLSRLINNVLDFSKIEQGEKRYHLEEARLDEVVRSAAGALAYPLNQQGFTLNVELDDNVPHVSVDRDAIEQAILNLLANAVKYSGDAREIDLKLGRRNGHAAISVTDHGVGIPTSEQARIFDKFYRVTSPENERVPGTGLGLALVAHIAEAHGGRVHVQSEPGCGSTFILQIPLEDQA